MANIETGATNIGTILRDGKSYAVPEFQRDYSWEAEQIDQLWDDFQSAIKDGRDDYFIGSVVINDQDTSEYKIIDGQQRLTTISILVCVLRDHAKGSGQPDLANQISADFLGKYRYSTKETTPKISLNSNNRDFYDEQIINGGDITFMSKAKTQRSLLKSNRKLAACYCNFYEKVDYELKSGRSLEDLVNSIVDAIDDTFQVIKIAVKDDYDAYLLFETLNDRGLALSVADLLKNYIFSRAGDRVQSTQEAWRVMSTNLDQIETKRFLRHYWISVEEVVRDKYLYRTIANRFDTKKKVYDLAKSLRDSSEYYAALSDPDSIVWTIFDEPDRTKIKSLLREVEVLDVNQYNPLLLAVVEENPKIFSSVLNLVVSFAFRYSIILGSGTGNIEKTFASAAHFVRKNPKCSSKEVFEKIRSLYPNDNEFEVAFANKELKSAKIARYILQKINDKIEGSSGLATNKDSRAVNLEHLLPQKFKSEDWKDFCTSDEETPSEFVHRIGNMTLLPSIINRKLSNGSFSEKMGGGYFEKSPLKINEYVAKCEDWTSTNVAKRQADLAKIARTIWRVDF